MRKDHEILRQMDEIKEMRRQVEVKAFAVFVNFENLCMTCIYTQPGLV